MSPADDLGQRSAQDKRKVRRIPEQIQTGDEESEAPWMSPMEQDVGVRRSLRTPRAAGIAGVLFALLLTAALVLVRLAASRSTPS